MLPEQKERLLVQARHATRSSRRKNLLYSRPRISNLTNTASPSLYLAICSVLFGRRKLHVLWVLVLGRDDEITLVKSTWKIR